MSDAGVLDFHGCPVFSRQWIEQQKLIFEEVINAERVRVNTILMDKLTRAVVKACKTQDPGQARHIMAFHALVARAPTFS